MACPLTSPPGILAREQEYVRFAVCFDRFGPVVCAGSDCEMTFWSSYGAQPRGTTIAAAAGNAGGLHGILHTRDHGMLASNKMR
jgi:hypothetical protein